MSLKPFTYPFPETRFLHAGSNVYKFKIRYGNNVRQAFSKETLRKALPRAAVQRIAVPARERSELDVGEEEDNKEVIFQELEDSIRVVLGNLEDLQPFATEHFVVFPYKSKWERVSHLKFQHGEILLVPYPFVFTLYVEMKWAHEGLPPGKPVSDRPLGLVYTQRGAVDTKKKRKYLELPEFPHGPAADSIQMGTSSPGPSNKKPLMETQRNRDRKMEPVAFGSIGFQDPDSLCGHSLAEPGIPSLQQSSPPPPKGPDGLGTGGFFGFISSLFPFRYFFRGSSQ